MACATTTRTPFRGARLGTTSIFQRATRHHRPPHARCRGVRITRRGRASPGHRPRLGPTLSAAAGGPAATVRGSATDHDGRWLPRRSSPISLARGVWWRSPRSSSANSIADEARDHFTQIAPRQGQANDRQNGRRRSGQRRRRARRPREHTASVDDPEAEAAWEALDGVDLQDELRHPVPTLQDVPPFLRAAVRGALVKALAHLHAALVAGQGNSAGAGRAWKLFLLAPRMLLARPEHQGAQGRALLLARAQAFQRGEWSQLLAAARPSTRPETPPQLDAEALAERKCEQACAKVRQGELSRARHVLTAAELAPGTEATWDALTDPAKRPPEARAALPQHLLQCQPELPVRLSSRAVATALREARRGGAAGLSGMRAEHLKLLLQDLEALELLTEAATCLAQANVPSDIAAGLAMARLTALRKPDGGVRGIATGDVFRRLVSRTLAKEWAHTFDQATRPSQFALQARAGTDALAACARAALSLRPEAVLVSLDGRSAYDCMSRTAFLTKLHEVAPTLLPVR